MKISPDTRISRAILFCLCILLLQACQTIVTPSLTASLPATPTQLPTRTPGLSQDQLLTLESLEMVDDYPLYVMQYFAEHETIDSSLNSGRDQERKSLQASGFQSPGDNWSCSLFAAFGDLRNPLYGRNFDWRYSPVMVLYTHPENANASVSLVDIEYLLGDLASSIMDLPLEQRLPLLDAPEWPFDGMNECGLVIGMAAVPTSYDYQPHPQLTNIDSLGIMREILDHACTVDEAVSMMQSYNIMWEGGPELHYLVAESSGTAVLVEYFQGNMQIIPNQDPWHLATNFYLSGAVDNPLGVCHRYDTISSVMQDNSGKLSSRQAMHLLSQVSQDITQWSVVYNAAVGEVQIVVGREYANPYYFELEMKP